MALVTAENSKDDGPIIEQVAAALQALETEGEEAYRSYLAARPEAAQAIASRIERLKQLGFLSGPAMSEPESGTTIGSYRILRRQGSGGMGIVFLAEDERLNRRVALKVLPGRFGPSDTARLRFEREAKAIAKLSHPSIVPVYETGEHSGLPWFAMEFVEGVTLADVIAGLQRLGLPPGELKAVHLKRLLGKRARAIPWTSFVEGACSIVLDVAEALDHAHRNGVLHRDVKPSNVIVTGDGRAKLFDFGLARLEGETSLTLTKDLAGTPYYLAPEQIEKGRGAIDAQSDVWSLGVTLYELLTLSPPFLGETSEQVFRQILLREPDWPRRGNAQVPSDLEVVVLTAIDKVKGRRYATARALADDLKRVLDRRPIAARPISTATRFFRHAWRNKAASSAFALLLVLSIGGPAALVIANFRIQRERDLAEKIVQLWERIIFEGDIEELGPNTPIVTLLELQTPKIREELADYPLHLARLLQKIGAFLSEASHLDPAVGYLREALAIQLEELGENDAATAETLNHLGNVERARAHLPEASELYGRAIAAYTATLGRSHSRTIGVQINLGALFTEMGRLDEAERTFDAAAEALAASARPELGVRVTLATLRGVISSRRNDPRAEVYCREARDLAREAHGERSQFYAAACGALGRVLQDLGRFDEAEHEYRRQHEIYRDLLGDGKWNTALALCFLADCQRKQDKFAVARAGYEAAAATVAAELGEESLWVARIPLSIGLIDVEEGKLDDAAERLERALEKLRALATPARVDEGVALLALARVAWARGQPDEEARLVDEGLRALQEGLAGDPHGLERRITDLAAKARKQGRTAFLEALERAMPRR